jgi:hypothetical protein
MQFFSSTFNKGERVVLLTAGGDTIVAGVVEAINLLNTTVRTDLGVPVSIPNKVARLSVRSFTHCGYIRICQSPCHVAHGIPRVPICRTWLDMTVCDPRAGGGGDAGEERVAHQV